MTHALFVSHGSPMIALEPGPWAARFERLGRSIARPRAIVALSPHWMTRAPAVGTAARLPGIHDYAGFPAALHAIRTEHVGDAALAARVAEAMRSGGFPSTAQVELPGLDHGVWVPLRLMFGADVPPVVQVALPWRATPSEVHVLGACVGAAVDDDVLVLGSGSLTHNLHEVRFEARDAEAEPYAAEFAGWIAARLAAGDREALVDYRRRAPHAERAHPTDEHLLPLHFALGAAGAGAHVEHVLDGFTHGVLAMDAWRFDPVTAPVTG